MGKLPDLFNLTDRVAIVTGGAGLLGAEFCQTLMEAGADIVIADIDDDAANDLAESLNGRFLSGDSTPRAVPFQVDISSKSSVQGLFQRTLDQFSKLDILVNAAVLDPKFDPQSIADGNSDHGLEESDHLLAINF
ncbi:unnamed protein product, partial [marine sediment metagenome]